MNTSGKTSLFLAPIFLVFSSCFIHHNTYSVYPKNGTNTQGSVKFSASKKGLVTMNLTLENLTPGSHAVHIHEFGDCSAIDAKSAGGHWNPAKDDHGKWGDNHFHMGDIGNLKADNLGKASLTFKTDKWCLGCNDASKNIIGKSLIIHENEDDFHSQPTGNAGGRVGCVEIK